MHTFQLNDRASFGDDQATVIGVTSDSVELRFDDGQTATFSGENIQALRKLEGDPIRDAIKRASGQLADDLGVTPAALQSAVLDEAADTVDLDEQQGNGPFDFYQATPVPPTPEVREQMIAQTMASEPRLQRDAAERIVDECSKDLIARSSVYQVAIREAETGFDHHCLHLSIKRVDREPIHDWRDLQQIKNAIVGHECEAIELYPAESRLVDTANQYHLWAFTDPQVRVPLGFVQRLVDLVPVGKSVQRQFIAEDALWPSKVQLAEALRDLHQFIAERTVINNTAVPFAKAGTLLKQIDRAKQIIHDMRNAVLPDELRDAIEKIGIDAVAAAARADKTGMPWCEHCKSYHHSTAPHINTAARLAYKFNAARDLIERAQDVLSPIACGDVPDFGTKDVANRCDELLQEARDALTGLLNGIEKLTGDKP